MRRRPTDSKLDEVIDQLHQGALQAIRDNRPISLRDIAKTYVEVLASIPQAWGKYAVTYTTEIGRPLEFLGTSPQSQIERNLYLELAEAARNGSSESFAEVTSIPFSTAAAAAQENAPGLLRPMLDLLVAAHELQSNSRRDLDDTTPSHAARLFMEIINFYVAPSIVQQLPVDLAISRLQLLATCFLAIRDFMKTLVDRRDVDNFLWMNGQWDQVLQYWEPEQGVIEYERNRPAVDEALTSVMSLRDSSRIELLAWVLRGLGESPNDEVLSEMFKDLGNGLESPQQLTEAVSHALRWDDRREGISGLGAWTMDWHSEGRVQPIATDMLVKRAFVARLIMMAARGPISVPPREWIRLGQEELMQHLASLSESQLPWSDLGVDEVQSATSRVEEALMDAVARQEQIERTALISAPLDASRVAEFRAGVSKNWLELRLIHALLSHVGATQAPATQTPRIGYQRFLPKYPFVDDPSNAGPALIADDFGRGLARSENDGLFELLSEYGTVHEVSTLELAVAETSSVLSSLIAAGYEATAMFVPIDLAIIEVLGLGYGFDASIEVSDLEIPPAAARFYSGAFEGVPVFRDNHVADRSILVADLRSFCLASMALGESDLRTEIEAIDAERAEQLATESVERGEIAPAQLEERRDLLRTYVSCDISVPYDLEVRQASAAHVVRVLPVA